jgi:hypothetical protein
MVTLIVSAKLFVQDRVASGLCVARPKHIFALHLYTLNTSIFKDANTAMRQLDGVGVSRWRPFIWALSQALDTLNVRSAVVFRGLKLWQETSGTVQNFLDGAYPPAPEPGLGDRNRRSTASSAATSKYWPGSIVVWPSFSSTTTDFNIALGYGTKNLHKERGEAAVILKIYTQRARPVEQFSFFPYEKELLYPPNTQLRVTGLWDPTSFNIRQGTQLTDGEFQIATDHLQQGSLSLEEARGRHKILITLAEEAIGEQSVARALSFDDAPPTAESEQSEPPRTVEEAPVLSVPSIDDYRSTGSWQPLGTLPVPAGMSSLEVSCDWKDQGWGNTKGRVRVVLYCGTELKCEADCFGICAQGMLRGEQWGPNAQYTPAKRVFDRVSPLLSLASRGYHCVFEYFVGEGGGHELFIRDFRVLAQVVATANDSVSGEGARGSSADDERVELHGENGGPVAVSAAELSQSPRDRVESILGQVATECVNHGPPLPLRFMSERLLCIADAWPSELTPIVAIDAGARDLDLVSLKELEACLSGALSSAIDAMGGADNWTQWSGVSVPDLLRFISSYMQFFMASRAARDHKPSAAAASGRPPLQ